MVALLCLLLASCHKEGPPPQRPAPAVTANRPVQREIVEYTTLTQGALQSTKIIAESLKKVSGAQPETADQELSYFHIDLEGPTAAEPISSFPA